MIIFINGITPLNVVQAAQISNANLHYAGDCGNLLKYKGIVVKISYIEYDQNGNKYPAYCLDKTKMGVMPEDEYSVSVSDAIKDVGLWKIITNGYPYKTLEELGVANKEEAFSATKQAVYCYIHGNNPNDYEGIGEAGIRTLNAMYKIINDANNSTETVISNTININKIDSEWKQDENEKKYVSKEYKVSANVAVKKYNVEVVKENSIDLGGIKIVDKNNVERNEFEPEESFKVLVPIYNMYENGKIQLNVKSEIKTKPILYGKSADTSKQDYALTTEMYEDGFGKSFDEYFKNETKLIIIKQDQEDEKIKLEEVEFQLLDENKNIIYSGLKTNSDGKIVVDNMIPGKYYLQEINTKDGYDLYPELIELNVNLNEQLLINVNNSKKEEKPKEIVKKERSVSNKKLPLTGM